MILVQVLVFAVPWTAGAVETCSVVAVSSTAGTASQAASTADPAPVDEFIEYTYVVPAGPIGSFADCPISRTFPGPISDIRVTLVSGTADDIGFVGSLQVTDAPPSCSRVGSVQAPIDVSSQVTVNGDTASLVLRAMENCCCVTGWGQATQSDRSNALLHWEVSFGAPTIEITLDPQPANDQYVIDATPSMPTVRAKARVVGVTPDPTPNTTFTWTASLIVHENRPPQDVDFASDIVQNTTTLGEALYTMELADRRDFRGGRLKLKATATVDGQSLSGETPDGLTIVGTNPQRITIQSYIDGLSLGGHGLSRGDVADALKRMACREGPGQRQFTGLANGGLGLPIISGDDGVGLLQITNDPCDPFATCRNVMFNWQENATAGGNALSNKVANSSGHTRRLATFQGYKDYIATTINPQRVQAGLEAINVTRGNAPVAPFLTDGVMGSSPPNHLLEDSVRGYNGWNGFSEFGANLREFVPDSGFLTTATDAELRQIHQSSARFWRRVRADERPSGPSAGDPNYVGNVIALSPQCGG